EAWRAPIDALRRPGLAQLVDVTVDQATAGFLRPQSRRRRERPGNIGFVAEGHEGVHSQKRALTDVCCWSEAEHAHNETLLKSPEIARKPTSARSRSRSAAISPPGRVCAIVTRSGAGGDLASIQNK